MIRIEEMPGANSDNSDPRDYQLDISSLRPSSADNASPQTSAPRDLDTLNILFRCCNVYAKIRLTRDAQAFAGHCPRCARPIRVDIDPNSPNTGQFFAVE